MSENRDAERLEVLGGVRGDVLVPQSIAITQISRTGMQVETGFPLQLAALYEFRLTLATQSVVVKGRVAHARVSDVERDLLAYRSGIEFVDVSPGVTAAIAEYVEAIQQAREK